MENTNECLKHLFDGEAPQFGEQLHTTIHQTLRLKELGVNMDNSFLLLVNFKDQDIIDFEPVIRFEKDGYSSTHGAIEAYSVLTTQEVLDLLPESLCDEEWVLKVVKVNGDYEVSYISTLEHDEYGIAPHLVYFTNDTLIENCVKMVEWLVKNNYLKFNHGE